MTDRLHDILERLTQARKNAGLSQGQAAKLLGLEGASSLSPIEVGKYPLTVERFLAMCHFYRISPTWALTGVNPFIDAQTLVPILKDHRAETEAILELLTSMKSEDEP